MENRTLVGIVVAVLLVVALVYAKAAGKSAAEERVKEQAMAILRKVPEFGTDEGLYVALIEAHHRAAFEHHSQVSGSARRTRLTVDAEGYLDELFWEMTVDAARQGYTKQSQRIRDARPLPEPVKKRR